MVLFIYIYIYLYKYPLGPTDQPTNQPTEMSTHARCSGSPTDTSGRGWRKRKKNPAQLRRDRQKSRKDRQLEMQESAKELLKLQQRLSQEWWIETYGDTVKPSKLMMTSKLQSDSGLSVNIVARMIEYRSCILQLKWTCGECNAQCFIGSKDCFRCESTSGHPTEDTDDY